MLRIYGFSEPVKQAIDATIARFWTRGVQDQGAREETWQWKLRGACIELLHLGFGVIRELLSGKPWYGQRDEAVSCVPLASHLPP
jgi:hypothetical protein